MNIPFAILKLGFNAKQMEIHHMCANMILMRNLRVQSRKNEESLTDEWVGLGQKLQ